MNPQAPSWVLIGSLWKKVHRADFSFFFLINFSEQHSKHKSCGYGIITPPLSIDAKSFLNAPGNGRCVVMMDIIHAEHITSLTSRETQFFSTHNPQPQTGDELFNQITELKTGVCIVSHNGINIAACLECVEGLKTGGHVTKVWIHLVLCLQEYLVQPSSPHSPQPL